jgi:peptidoglycan/LPS O-acetylase OafA/YrhL
MDRTSYRLGEPHSRHPAVLPDRFPAVEALRGIAAVSVLASHAAEFIGALVLSSLGGLLAELGREGVAVFFVISGFVLYRPLVRSRWLDSPRPSWLMWLRRRAARILPAYWIALTALTVVYGLPDVFSSSWWRYYGLTQIYTEHASRGGLGVAWTLCVEATFYGALIVYTRLLDRSRRLEFSRAVGTESAILVGLSILSLAATAVLYATDQVQLTSTLPALFDWFTAGMGLALFTVWVELAPQRARWLRPSRTRPVLLLAAAALLYLVLCYSLGLPRLGTDRPSSGLVAVTSGQLLKGVIAAVIVWVAVIEVSLSPRRWRWATSRPLMFLGVVSYGLYLWHGPIAYDFARSGAATVIPGSRIISVIICVFVVSLALATASFFLVERPAMRWRWRMLKDASRGSRARPG